ncbi:MAG: hypothetical protein E7667_04165 [Ruminococcaceae bacterium]|nr:hypothetical protein [Oscillospiraceae bacterium]
MFVDLIEKTRTRICLRSGQQEDLWMVANKYASEGYDLVAVTHKGGFVSEGEGVLSSMECKIGNPESTDGEFTIVGIGMTSNPEIPADWENMIKTSSSKASEAVKLIHRCNGYAILCGCISHKNIPDEIMRIEGLDAIEICNIERGEEGEAAVLCDILASMGKPLGIFCSGEGVLGGVCVEAKEAEHQSMIRALKAGRYYSSEGDGEVHISQLPSGRIQVNCSPSLRIEFFTDSTEENTRRFVGKDLVFAEYVPLEGEKFVRAEITDINGKRAWTNYIEV